MVCAVGLAVLLALMNDDRPKTQRIHQSVLLCGAPSILHAYVCIDGEFLQGLFGRFLETPETRIEISAQEQRNLCSMV